MTTRDKHCQTFPVNKSAAVDEGSNVMYDETVPVPNAREIESPASSDGEGVLRAAMAKFNPPVRHTAKHDFDSESETDSGEDFLNNMVGDESPDRKSMTTTTSTKAPAEEKPKELQRQSSEGRESMKTKPVLQKRSDTSNSETDSGSPEESPARPPASSGRRRVVGVVIPAEGAYDPKQYQDLKVPSDIENLFQYIMKYTPQKIDIEFKLQPFVPEYVPAVGDIDAFLKVTPPACNVRAAPLSERVLHHIDNQGLTVLDEPVAEQSDSALLHLQLRAISKISSAKSTVLTKKIESAEKNPKAIDRWIKDVSELHLSKPAPTVTYTGASQMFADEHIDDFYAIMRKRTASHMSRVRGSSNSILETLAEKPDCPILGHWMSMHVYAPSDPNSKMPDIDSLMEEWPESMEETLNEVGFPSPSLDCSLSQYVELVCALFDIPIPGDTLNDRIQALHLLFSLYSAVSHQQHFVDRKENVV